MTLFKPGFDGRPLKVTLHPNCFADPRPAGMICQLAVLLNYYHRARVAVTWPILDAAEQMRMAGAPSETLPQVQREIESIAKTFSDMHRLDRTRGNWDTTRRCALPSPGDPAAAQAVLDRASQVVVSATPNTLRRFAMPLSVEVVSIRQFVNVIDDYSHTLTELAIFQDFEDSNLSISTYAAFLEHQRLAHLTGALTLGARRRR